MYELLWHNTGSGAAADHQRHRDAGRCGNGPRVQDDPAEVFGAHASRDPVRDAHWTTGDRDRRRRRFYDSVVSHLRAIHDTERMSVGNSARSPRSSAIGVGLAISRGVRSWLATRSLLKQWLAASTPITSRIDQSSDFRSATLVSDHRRRGRASPALVYRQSRARVVE